MLDDLAYIHRVDKSDSIGIALKEPDQLLHDFKFNNLNINNVKNVVYVGMGGSALAANLSLSWPAYKVPFEIVKNYDLPEYVSSDTLCIFSSASGNTEETLSALSQAEHRLTNIAIFAGGGELLSIAKYKNYVHVELPNARQPRYGVFYNLKALVSLADQLGLTKEGLGLLNSAAEWIKQRSQQWGPTIPTKNNLAKQIALDALGKSVVIYGGPNLYPVAYKWKVGFNENAKQVAWCSGYPEFNHNEFIGWSEQPVDKPYCVIDLRSKFENERVQKRFELSERLLSGRRPAPIVIEAEGENSLEQLLYCSMLGDFVSLYAAIAAGNDPEPVELVEKFKHMMAN